MLNDVDNDCDSLTDVDALTLALVDADVLNDVDNDCDSLTDVDALVLALVEAL